MDQPGLPAAPPPDAADDRNWRGPRGRVAQLWRARRVKRWLSLALLLALTLALGWLLYAPFDHPQTFLVFISAGEYRAPEVAPLRFSAEDYAALKQLTGALGIVGRDDGLEALGSLRNREALVHLPQRLAALDATESDVLLAYVTAHGVSDDGVAYLLCADFNPADPSQGRARARDLLAHLGRSAAGVKLLLLDAAQFPYAPRLGLIANEFPRLLEQEVARTGDESLWVLTSASSLETSNVAPSIERSLFGYYVARGLAGAADLDGDKVVDIDELHRYVSANVTVTVSETSGGSRRQRPQLLWGGGPVDDRAPRPPLLSISRFGDLAATQNLESLVEQTRIASREGGLKAVKPRGALREKLAGLVSGALQGDSEGAAEQAEATPGEVTRRSARRASEAESPPATAGAAAGEPNSAATPAGASKATDDKAPAAAAPTKPPAPSAGAPAASPNAANADAASPDGKSTAAADGKANGSDKPSAASPAKPGEQPPGAAGNDMAPAGRRGAGDSPPLPADLAPLNVPRLLSGAWQLRDRLARGDTVYGSPCEEIPELWRDFELRLLSLEGAYRSGRMVDPKALAAQLRNLIEAWRAWPDPPAEAPGEKASAVARRLSAARSRELAGATPGVSLAWSSFLVARGGAAPSAEAVAAGERLASIEASGDLAELLTWARGLPSDCQQYAELRWAKRLALEGTAPWPVETLSIQARRLADRMGAVAPPAIAWIRPLVSESDGARLAVERRLLDDTAPLDRVSLERSLRRAIDGYREAQSIAGKVAAARRHADTALANASAYVRWRRLAGPRPKFPTPRESDLLRYFAAIERLAARLRTPEPERLAELERLGSELTTIESAVSGGLSDDVLAEMLTTPTEPGDAAAIELRLKTPLLAWPARGRLLGAAADVDGQSLLALRLEDLPAAPPDDPLAAEEQWAALREQARVETALARLAVPVAKDDAQWQALERALRAVADSAPGKTSSRDDQRQWAAQRAFGLALQDFYRALPGRIQAAAGNWARSADSNAAARLAEADAIQFARRLVSPSDLAQLDERAVVVPARTAQIAASIAWQAERTSRELLDARSEEADYLADAISLLDHQAAALPGGAALARSAGADLKVYGPERLNLSTEVWTPATITLGLEGVGSVAAWAIVDFDPELVTVSATPDVRVYAQRDLETLWAEYLLGHRVSPANRYPLEPAALRLAPSLELTSGVPQKLALKVQAKSAAPRLGKLIVKLVGGGSYVRREIMLQPPPADLVAIDIEGIPGSFTPGEDGVSLNTFPNRPTQYRLSLRNTTRVSRVVNIDLWEDTQPDAPLPTRPLTPAEAEPLLLRWRGAASLAALADVALPADRSTPLPFPKPDEKATATPLATGMLLVVTDRQTQLKTFKRLSIAPQRPRRFLQARTRYDAGRQRIDINIRAQDPSLLPPEGVMARAEISPPPPRVAQTQLDGEIKAPEYEANLFAQIPVESDVDYEVRVAVDNYPRAFVFRVATSGASSDAAEQADKLAMRWIAPAAGSAFPGPGGTIPVEFQVDSPTGSFSIPSDFVEVGLDVNRDRELTGEPALQMKSDRQVTVSLDKLEPEGRMTISTLVRDFKLDLPSGMIRAKRVNLLGRVQVNGRTAWSRPVEIVLDGVGPRIVRVELKPTMGVAVKGELDATITTNDDALSGVSGVEAAVDADGSGKFSEGNKPVEAKRIASNRWSVKLPTGEIQPGEYNVIARAKDEVGNLGEFVRARFEVLGPEGLAARQVNQLRGMVTYSKVEEPQAGADVWLTAEKPGAKPLPSKPPAGKPKVPPFKSTKTSAQGEFTFVGIPPGKYKLEAELLIAGKIRKAETQIEIPPAPGKIEAVRLKIQ